MDGRKTYKNIIWFWLQMNSFCVFCPPRHNMATIFGLIWMQINKFITHRIILCFFSSFSSVLFIKIYVFRIYFSPVSACTMSKFYWNCQRTSVLVQKKVHENFIQLIDWSDEQMRRRRSKRRTTTWLYFEDF